MKHAPCITHHTSPLGPVTVPLDRFRCVIDAGAPDVDCPNPVTGYILQDGQFYGIAYCDEHRDEATRQAETRRTA